MRSIAAVLFDFDGTILDTEWTIYQEVLAIFKSEGYDLPLEMYAKCVGSSYATWSPQTYLEELSGKVYDWDTINIERDRKIKARLNTLEAMVGVEDSLKECLAQGLRLAVASSSSHDWVESWLEKLNLTHYFETIICREDVKQIKPAPDLFLKAAEALQLHPSECLVIEDSRNGVLAAQSANMRVFAVPNRISIVSDFPNSTTMLNSLTEFKEALQQTVKACS